MKMVTRSIISAAFILVLLSCPVAGFGQTQDAILENKRITIQMTKKPLYTVLLRLIQKYDVAVGLEQSLLDNDHDDYEFGVNISVDPSSPEYSGDKEILPSKVLFDEHLFTIDLKEATLKEVMNTVVKQMEHYDWTIDNGVVNIFPTKGRDQRLVDLLNTKVREFRLEKGKEIGSIHAGLVLNLPELRTFASKNNIEISRDGQTSVFHHRGIPESLNFSYLSFKDLLNSITKAKRGGWILKIKTTGEHPKKQFVEIFI